MSLSASDPLTELLNRRALQNAVEEDLKEKKNRLLYIHRYR